MKRVPMTDHGMLARLTSLVGLFVLFVSGAPSNASPLRLDEPRSPEPRGPARRQTLTVTLFDPARLLPLGSGILEKEASAILDDTGLEIDWKHSFRVKKNRPRGDLVVVLRSEPPVGWRTGDPIMGAVKPGLPVVWIFLSNVARVLGESSFTLGASAMQGNAGFARAVGRVVAHELVHAIAPAHGHTSEGLMQARWTRAYLIRPDVHLDKVCLRSLRSVLIQRDERGRHISKW